MKRKIILSTILILIIALSLVLIYPKKENEIMKNKSSKKNNFLSIMIEEQAGTGKYNEMDEFPQSGYILNYNLSKCLNGSKIKFEDGSISVIGNKTDRCYVYFDYDALGSLCRNQNMSECFVKNYKKDGSIIYHDGLPDYEGMANSDLEAGDLSYRYIGGNAIVKNYVCLDGTTTSGACNSDDLYRIIGLFKNSNDQYEIKLIKATLATVVELGDQNAKISDEDLTPSAYFSDTSYYWNNTDKEHVDFNDKNSNTNTNMWQYSNLNKVNLNNFYYKYITNKVSFLKDNITNHTWITGGYADSDLDAKATYDEELGTGRIKENDNVCYTQGNIATPRLCTKEDIEYTDHIGLMYISDYMYATLPEKWIKTALNYKDQDVSINNWMFIGKNEWSISRLSYNGIYARDIRSNASAFYGTNVVYNLNVVRPVFYISFDVKLKEGNGSKENPFRLNFNK